MDTACLESISPHDGDASDQGRTAMADAIDWEVAPLEVLERRLTSWAATLAAAEARWLQWLAVYARREGFLEWECRSAAHWLSWKCGMSPGTAREKVRVALALEELPSITAEFAAGRLSYSKVRSLTRVANEFNEEDLAYMAVNASGAQLDAICAGYRRSKPVGDAAAAFAARRFTVRDNLDGTSTIAWTLPTDAALVVEATVEGEVDREIAAATAPTRTDESSARTRREIISERGGIGAMRSDAATTLLLERSTATEGKPPGTPPPPPSPPATAATDITMVVQAPARRDAPENVPAGTSPPTHSCVTAGRMEGRWLEPDVTERLSCDPLITALIEGADHEPLAVGRATRLISRRLRIALEHRDNRTCQFPGCASDRHLHAHHIIHWSRGGPTDLDNLMLLCHFHHHAVHDRGWTITADRAFHRPDGMQADPRPDTAHQEFDPRNDLIDMQVADAAERPDRLEPPDFGPFDLPWTTTILHHNEQLRRDRHAT